MGEKGMDDGSAVVTRGLSSAMRRDDSVGTSVASAVGEKATDALHRAHERAADAAADRIVERGP
ncbi:hypothetical protein [Cumulibacter manganitolerans]|uniref:hypothetical protein n=1 Tax=Cumulibacter manganitolerans TaxID=1884992 RepID=UPI00129636DB|nr:hypothetical protein [Cumulibacter manganitolerans]